MTTIELKPVYGVTTTFTVTTMNVATTYGSQPVQILFSRLLVFPVQILNIRTLSCWKHNLDRINRLRDNFHRI